MSSKVLYKFADESCMDELKWMNTPSKWNLSASEENGLQVYMDKETDFWQKTYYNPPLLNDNGHLLYKQIANKVVFETTFHLNAKQQFDQAGLMIYKDKDTWIKTGLEAVDGKHRLSVVVTNTYSDWSTQAHASGDLSIRIYRFGDSFVIEAKSDSFGDWDFIRICHLNVDQNEPLKAGLLACAPLKEGGSATFDYLSYEDCQEYQHKAT